MMQIDDLQVELDAEAGLVRAIDGLRLAIERGETFALVGESGCGKSMTALALMRLLPDNGSVTAGSILLDMPGGGRVDTVDLPEAAMRRVRGGRIGMIFQEPGTSLNPVMRVGDQIVEAIETHTRAARRGGARQGDRLAAARRHSRARAPHRRLPVPHERRPEAARDDRDGAGGRTRLPDRRRADHGAGRHDPGADPGPAARRCSESSAWACC